MVQINIRGAQTRAAKTRQDTSRLRSIQDQAQDTSSLLSLGQSALKLGSSLADEKESKEIRSEAAALEVQSKTQEEDLLRGAAEKGAKDAEFSSGTGGMLVSPVGVPFATTPKFEAKAFDFNKSEHESIQQAASAINEISAAEQSQIYESSFDGTLLKRSFENIPERMVSLPDRLKFITRHFESDRAIFKDPDSAEGSMAQLMSKYARGEIQYVDGGDILDYSGNYIEEVTGAMEEAGVSSADRGMVYRDLGAALTNTIAGNTDAIAFETAGLTEEAFNQRMSLLPHLQLRPSEIDRVSRKFTGMRAINEYMEEHRVDVTQASAASDLNRQFGSDNLSVFSVQYNDNLLLDGYQGNEAFIKIGGVAPISQRVASLLGTIFVGDIPPEFQYLVSTSGGGGYGGSSGSSTGGPARGKANTASSQFGELPPEDRKKYLTTAYNVLTGSAVGEVSGDDIQRVFDVSEESFATLVEGLMKQEGTWYSSNPDASLEPGTFDRFLDSALGRGAYLQRDGNRNVIRFDPMRIMQGGSGERVGTAIDAAKKENPVAFREYEGGTFTVEPGYSAGDPYKVSWTGPDGSVRSLPSSGSVYQGIMNSVGKQEPSTPPAPVVEAVSDGPPTGEDDYPLELRAGLTSSTVIAFLDGAGLLQDFSEGEKEALGENLAGPGAAVDLGAGIATVLKTVDMKNGMVTKAGVEKQIAALTRQIPISSGGRAYSSALALERGVARLVSKDEPAKIMSRVVAGVEANLANVRVSDADKANLIKSEYRKALAKVLTDDPKGWKAFRKAARNASLKGVASGLARAPVAAAGLTWKHLIRPLASVKGVAAGVAIVMKETISEAQCQAQFGMSLGEVQKEILERCGVTEDVSGSGALERLWEGESNGMAIDALRVGVSPFLWMGGSSVAEIEGTIRSLPGVLIDPGVESGLDHVGNQRRNESNLLGEEGMIDRALDATVGRLTGGLMLTKDFFGGEPFTLGNFRALAEHEVSAMYLPTEVVSLLETNTYEDRRKELSGAIVGIEGLEEIRGSDGLLTIMGANPVAGMAPVTAEDYESLFSRLVHSALGEGDIPKEEAEEAIAQIYRLEGINPVTVHLLAKEALSIAQPQDADRFASRLDLSNPGLEGFVTAFDRYEESHGFDKGVAREKRYLSWVSDGMPMGAVGEEFYPLSPDVMSALGFASDSDYVHFTSVNYDAKGGVVNTIGHLRGEVGEFLSYLEDEMARGNGMPTDPSQVQRAFVDFKAFRDHERRVQELLDSTPQPSSAPLRDQFLSGTAGVATSPDGSRQHLVSPESALDKLRMEFDRQVSVASSMATADSPPPANSGWTETFSQRATAQLKASLPPHLDWPVLYSDTPKEPMWEFSKWDPTSVRSTIEKRIHYLNTKIELEQSRSREYGSRAAYIGAMEKAIQALRQVKDQTFSSPDEQASRRLGLPSSVSIESRWSAYTFPKANA